MTTFIYLHGFASSPQSAKAQYFRNQFASLGIPLQIPNLNQPDFSFLTLTRQLQQIETLLPVNDPVVLIGSSFGGLTAAWLGERFLQIKRLVLLAPAFQFLAHWQPRLGAESMQQWQQTGSLLVYHYGAQQQLPLRYSFITDLAQYDETTLHRSVPTLILHGTQDDVIPIQASRDFAADRAHVQLLELESDHALVDVEDTLWQATQAFCQLAKT
ncbi:MAG: alpha/beta fold hydrolase [Elainella sp. C42_A2020_010]|nr:alpha/beta fold hydrolase [Elainella sp. C42_A2020_010]